MGPVWGFVGVEGGGSCELHEEKFKEFGVSDVNAEQGGKGEGGG